jgi:hypothetical protein
MSHQIDPYNWAARAILLRKKGMDIGAIIDNRTICDVFGVASMGGIRVCKVRSHIVLISNNTDPDLP